MKVNSGIGFVILVIIGLASMAASLGAIWAWANFGSSLDERKVESEILRLHAAAFVYHSRLGSFEGVCTDIGVRSGYLCRETEEVFLVAAPLANGNYQCGDSTGFIGNVAILPPMGHACSN